MYKDKIFELREKGYSYRMIEKELGCSKGTISYHLGAGQKEKVNKRNNHNREKQTNKIREYKEALGCADCKLKFPHYVLEFDHLPEYEKIGSPSGVVRKYSWEKAVEEIDKCDVVCANCHSIRTWERQQGDDE